MKDTKNMLNTLARRSFSAGRIRNLIAVLAIALTAVLFTSVTTIGLGTYESLTLSMQLLKGSKSDGDFRNMTAEQFKALRRGFYQRIRAAHARWIPHQHRQTQY